MGETVEGRFSFGRYFMAVWIPLALGVLIFGFAVATLVARVKADRDAFDTALTLCIALVGVMFLGWCAAQLIGSTAKLTVGPEGLSWALRTGRSGSATWSDVREVYRDDSYQVAPGHRADQVPSEWLRKAHIRIVLQSGAAVIFRQTLSNFDALAATIQKYSAEVVIQAKLAEISERGEADFGRLGLGPAGLRIEREVRPWAELNYSVSQGWLSVVPNKDDFNMDDRNNIHLSEIPNYLGSGPE